MTVFPDVAVIDPNRAAEPVGVFAARPPDPDGLPDDIIISGADGLAWLSTVLTDTTASVALWPEPEAPVFVYGSLSADAPVVLLAGGGLGRFDATVLSPRADPPAAAAEIFGDHEIRGVDQSVTDAVQRLCGPADTAAMALAQIGASVTLRISPASDLGAALDAHIRATYSFTQHPAGPSVFARMAWTRGLGAVRVRKVAAIDADGLDSTAVLAPDRDARRAAADVLTREGSIDIITSTVPGAASSVFTDVATAFGGGGPILVSGDAAPTAPVLVLRGDAAEAERHRLGTDDAPTGGVAEDDDRYRAHQWAFAIHQAARAGTDTVRHGAPTLVSEAMALGIDPAFVGGDARGAVEFDMVERISAARGWHLIDPSVRPPLDAALDAARDQIRDSSAEMPGNVLRDLEELGARPGFWPELLSAVDVLDHGALIFHYPAGAIEILRAVVAAEGDGEELQRLLGPIKVAILGAFGGSS